MLGNGQPRPRTQHLPRARNLNQFWSQIIHGFVQACKRASVQACRRAGVQACKLARGSVFRSSACSFATVSCMNLISVALELVARFRVNRGGNHRVLLTRS